MIAIIENWGKQYKVSVGDVVVLEKIENVKNGDKITIKEVLLTADDEGSIDIGVPFAGSIVEVEVVNAMTKADKIRVVKWKAKKRYSKVQGHRQLHTEVKVLAIKKRTVKATDKKPAVKKAPAKKTTAKK